MVQVCLYFTINMVNTKQLIKLDYSSGTEFEQNILIVITG